MTLTKEMFERNLHVGHEKGYELVNVVCRVEDASVVRKLLQKL